MAEGLAGPFWVPYCGAAPLPAEVLARWNFDPLLLAALAGVALAWRLAIYRCGRAPLAPFIGGIAVLAVLFVSPFCALTSALFAARTVHHVLLIAVAAPLLAWSIPERRMWRKLPISRVDRHRCCGALGLARSRTLCHRAVARAGVLADAGEPAGIGDRVLGAVRQAAFRPPLPVCWLPWCRWVCSARS